MTPEQNSILTPDAVAALTALLHRFEAKYPEVREAIAELREQKAREAQELQELAETTKVA